VAEPLNFSTADEEIDVEGGKCKKSEDQGVDVMITIFADFR
jgi:hypothetical protein